MVELAIVLPLLVLIFFMTLDFARMYYFSVTLQNVARSGALYASDPYVADESPFSSTQDAALADASNLDPQPTITKVNGTDVTGRAYVEVTATYPFQTITGLPGLAGETVLTRTVRMHVSAIVPDTN